MIELPRMALGNIQAGASFCRLLGRLLQRFQERGIDVQMFAAQGRLDAASHLPLRFGASLRHLDSWLMEPDVSRSCLLRGGLQHDLSMIVGDFRPSARACGDWQAASFPVGGDLDTLCCQLQIPALVHVDVTLYDVCQPPKLPASACGILLSGCRDAKDLASWQTRLETLWGLPVLGGDFASSDAAGPLIEATRAGSAAASTAPFLPLARLLAFARTAPPLADPPHALTTLAPLQIAVAYDDAFHCYFPDTMELLENAGVRLIDFSPLRSEAVPDGTQLVWLGCGHPEDYAEKLAKNFCLQHSLQAFVRAGGPLYAEGGGLAYACETMECQSGCYRMAGVLPAHARFEPVAPRPVEFVPTNSAWLTCERLRGYLNANWSLSPGPRLQDYSTQSDCPLSLIGDRQAIGSRIHLHFASQPKLLQALLSSATSPRSNGL